ncbi:MAG: PKD domain-containing protein [Thermoplasmatales archaeon]|nr:PKD domain-containing protein [Thermoplasmatales archaeon]
MKKLTIFIVGMLVFSALAIANNPPEKPTINGPSSGEAGKEYTFTAVANDPDGDKIFYCFKWGDGNEFCTPYVNSGQQVEAKHTWQEKGTYVVTVTATDEHGAKSEPATLQVSMPHTLSSCRITKPRNGIYVFGIKVFPILGQIVIGDINVEVYATSDIKVVDFLLPMACGCGLKVMHSDSEPPFEWKWNEDYNNSEVLDEKFTQIIVKGYTSAWDEYRDEIMIYKVKI